MKKRLLCLLVSGFVALSGLLFVPQDTHAVPVDNPDTTIVAPDGNPGDENPDGEGAEDGEEAAAEGEEAKTCYDQVGAIGWLVCPTTGFLSKLIDGVYGIIQNLLQVNPVSTDQDSPIYVVWEYVRNLTNIIFIIFILVVVYSQLTGFGMSNYGIKRVLPRIVITAILVNLSFLICALAVDVSNVLGGSLRGVFTNIQEAAIANGAVNAVANFSVAEVVGAALGTAAVGTGAVIAGLAIAGGIGAALWMLLPIILAGVVAVIAALITLAARQALVLLLIMIAPLAFVAYLLPNTESWFKKWKDLFMRMLIFYPMFSVLFGASQLAGWVIITAATNWFGVILGIAVQILPLFAAWPLMKMSGTILGKVNDGVRRAAMPAQKGIGNWAGSHRDLSRQRYLAENARRYQLSRRLAQGLADRKLRREEDTGKYAATSKLRGQAFSASSVYHSDNRLNRMLGKAGTLTGRGERLYGLQEQDLRNTNTVKRIANDYDEGIGGTKDDRRIRNAKQRKRMDKTNDALVYAVDAGYIESSRTETVKAANLESHANRIEQARHNQNSAIYSQISGAFNNLDDKFERERSINNVLANAISMKAKVDHDTKSSYNALFERTAKTKDIFDRYKKSIESGNYNEMEAAIENLAIRGDFDLIVDGLTKDFDASKWDLNMQKHLADTLIRYKADSAPLATYAKALNVRRGKAAAGQPINEFISFADFARGATQAGDSAEIAAGLTLSALLGDIADPAIAASQDRNTFDFILGLARDGDLKIDPSNSESMLGFKLKQLRSAASSGRMDGEQLANLNALLTGGVSSLKAPTPTGDSEYDRKQMNKYNKALAFINNHSDLIRRNAEEYLNKMSAGQLAAMKESTFDSLNKTLKYLGGEAGVDDKEVMSADIRRLMGTAISGIEQPSAAAMRGSMNTEIARKLGIRI